MPRRWLQGSAQGFNPGNPQYRRLALKLKGREAGLMKLAPMAAPKIRLRNWIYFRVVSMSDLPPLQGDRFGPRSPGLKPWAESSSPFGARPFEPRLLAYATLTP